MGTFNSCAEDIVAGLKQLADGENAVPMSHHIRDYTMDVVSKVCIKCESISDESQYQMRVIINSQGL